MQPMPGQNNARPKVPDARGHPLPSRCLLLIMFLRQSPQQDSRPLTFPSMPQYAGKARMPLLFLRLPKRQELPTKGILPSSHPAVRTGTTENSLRIQWSTRQILHQWERDNLVWLIGPLPRVHHPFMGTSTAQGDIQAKQTCIPRNSLFQPINGADT